MGKPTRTRRASTTRTRLRSARVYAEGFRAYSQTVSAVSRNTVYAGSAVDAGMADKMCFVRGNTVVKAGSWVTFKNLAADRHTITIGDERAIPGGGLLPYGNLADIEPGRNYYDRAMRRSPRA